MIRWPWTNLQSLNLDWILATLKDLKQKVEDYATHVTATYNAGYPGAVNVTGDLDTNLNFDFTIPPGPRGEDGPEGPEGPEGPAGQSFKILGLVATTGDLPSGAAQGDCYAVGTNSSNTCYIWNGSQWQNIGNSMSIAPVVKSWGFIPSTNGWVLKYGSLIWYHAHFVAGDGFTKGEIIDTFTFDADISASGLSTFATVVVSGRDINGVLDSETAIWRLSPIVSGVNLISDTVTPSGTYQWTFDYMVVIK